MTITKDPSKMLELADRLDRSAIADAEYAVNNMLYAERADRKFRIAAALRAKAAAQ